MNTPTIDQQIAWMEWLAKEYNLPSEHKAVLETLKAVKALAERRGSQRNAIDQILACAPLTSEALKGASDE